MGKFLVVYIWVRIWAKIFLWTPCGLKGVCLKSRASKSKLVLHSSTLILYKSGCITVYVVEGMKSSIAKETEGEYNFLKYKYFMNREKLSFAELLKLLHVQEVLSGTFTPLSLENFNASGSCGHNKVASGILHNFNTLS